MQHWTVKANPDSGKGKIKGVGVWSPLGDSVATCKYSYGRGGSGLRIGPMAAGKEQSNG